jgi:hypothetical protein
MGGPDFLPDMDHQVLSIIFLVMSHVHNSLDVPCKASMHHVFGD